MGRTLGMMVVAEGVETPAQLAVLRKLGCHFAQGLLFGEPCTAEGLGALQRELAACHASVETAASAADALRICAKPGPLVPRIPSH